jgi:hypothetical protein
MEKSFTVKLWLWHSATVFVTAIAYLTLWYAFGFAHHLWGNQLFGMWKDAITGGAFLVIPYLIGGIVLGSRNAFHRTLTPVFGLLATVGERTLILTLAYITLLGFRQMQPDGTVFYVEGNAALLLAIQTEAIGYFDWPYLLLGIPLSLLVLCSTAYFVQQWKAKGVRNR